MKKADLMKRSYAIILLASFIIALSLVGYYLEEKQQNNKGTASLIIKTLGKTTTERFNFTKGNALGLLKQNHEVKTLLNDNFVECIDKVCANQDYLWGFYVNNKSINFGVKSYRLQDGDIIIFEFSNKNTGEKK